MHSFIFFFVKRNPNCLSFMLHETWICACPHSLQTCCTHRCYTQSMSLQQGHSLEKSLHNFTCIACTFMMTVKSRTFEISSQEDPEKRSRIIYIKVVISSGNIMRGFFFLCFFFVFSVLSAMCTYRLRRKKNGKGYLKMILIRINLLLN